MFFMHQVLGDMIPVVWNSIWIFLLNSFNTFRDCVETANVAGQMSIVPVLLTSTAILVAFLSLWARNTIAMANVNSSVVRGKNSTVSLLWIYCTILYAVLALGFFLISSYSQLPSAIFRKEDVQAIHFLLYRCGLAFMTAAFVMTFAHIFESIVTIFRKAGRNLTVFDDLSTSNSEIIRYNDSIHCVIILSFLIAFFSLAASILGVINSVWSLLWFADFVIPGLGWFWENQK